MMSIYSLSLDTFIIDVKIHTSIILNTRQVIEETKNIQTFIHFTLPVPTI